MDMARLYTSWDTSLDVIKHLIPDVIAVVTTLFEKVGPYMTSE